MTPTLQEMLREIIRDAIMARWAELTPVMQELALSMAHERDGSWERREAIQTAVSAALAAAIKAHTDTTFRAAVDALAKEKVRQSLAKKLKAQGMSTDMLDVIP